MFSPYPGRLTKVAFTPEDFHKIWVFPLKNVALHLKNFPEFKATPQKNSIFFYSTPKEILKFCNLVLKNSIGPQPVGKTKPFHFYKFLL